MISIAIALPVTLFLQGCFAIANSVNAPDAFLSWAGWRRLAFGLDANRRWHYTGPAGQPRRYVRWHVRSGGEPAPRTALNLCASAYAWLTCAQPPWVLEARQAEHAAEKAHAAAADGFDDDDDENGGDCAVDSYPAAAAAPLDAARRMARQKRAMAGAGLAGTYAVWAVFTWCGAMASHAGGGASIM